MNCIPFLLEHAPALMIAIPLIAAFVTPLIKKLGRLVRNMWVLLALAFAEFVAALLAMDVFTGNPHVYTLGASIPSLSAPAGFPIRIILVADAFSTLFAFLALGIALLAALFSWKYMKEEKGLDKFYTLMLLLSAAMTGLSITGDFFTMFVFLEVSSIAAAGLVAFSRSAESLEAAFKYIVVSSIGALFLLFGVGLIYGGHDLLNMAAISLQLAYGYTFIDVAALTLIASALLLKGGSFPVHMWKPDVYQKAPMQVTAMLITAAIISLYLLFRIVITVFGFAFWGTVGWLLVLLGAVSIFTGATMAIMQQDLRRLIGYAAVAEIGYVLLGVGSGMAMSTAGVFSIGAFIGGFFHMINDIVDMGLIFLVLGAMTYMTRKEDLSKISGLAHRSAFLTVMFMIGMLAISGMPPMNGFASKFLIYESVYFLNPVLAIIGIVGSILMLAMFVKVFASVFLGFPYKGRVNELPKTMALPILLLAITIILMGLFPQIVINYVVGPALEAAIGNIAYIGGVI